MGLQGTPGNTTVAPYSDGVSLHKDIIHSFVASTVISSGNLTLSAHARTTNPFSPNTNVLAFYEGMRIIVVQYQTGSTVVFNKWTDITKFTFTVNQTHAGYYKSGVTGYATNNVTIDVKWPTAVWDNAGVKDVYSMEFMLCYYNSDNPGGGISGWAFIPVGTPPQTGSSGGGTSYTTLSTTAHATGTSYVVNGPGTGSGWNTKFLRGDGTWQVPTNTTYSTAMAGNGNNLLVVSPNAVDLSGGALSSNAAKDGQNNIPVRWDRSHNCHVVNPDDIAEALRSIGIPI